MLFLLLYRCSGRATNLCSGVGAGAIIVFVQHSTPPLLVPFLFMPLPNARAPFPLMLSASASFDGSLVSFSLFRLCSFSIRLVLASALLSRIFPLPFRSAFFSFFTPRLEFLSSLRFALLFESFMPCELLLFF
ncbi:hypothetical protein M758_UG262400 [Ceratodon purpureus]|nr:hypothetical protein M758_UG262400 [Ceratodon purpureus]